MIRFFSVSFCLLMLAFSFSTARAGESQKCDDHGVTHDVSRFEQLGQYYRSPGAAALDPDAATGWWSGRCYFPHAPNRGEGHLLAITRHPHDAMTFYHAVLVSRARGLRRDYFDTLTEHEARAMDSIIADNRRDTGLAFPFEDGSWGSVSYIEGVPTVHLKMNGGMIVGRLTESRDRGESSASPAVAYCSWTRRVTPQRAP